jgi:hypothetical protein
MNLIHAIYLNKNRINSMPRWKIITLYKERKNLDTLISDFMKLDVFDASNNIISFLLSLGKLSNDIWGIKYNENYISIDMNAFYYIDGNNYECIITYYPKSNRFEINDDDVSYTIYRNTKNSNKINKMWEPLTVYIKDIYVDIILEMAEYISSSHLSQ